MSAVHQVIDNAHVAEAASTALLDVVQDIKCAFDSREECTVGALLPSLAIDCSLAGEKETWLSLYQKKTKQCLSELS